MLAGRRAGSKHRYTDNQLSSPEAIGLIMVGVPVAAIGVTYVASALVGRSRVSQCRDATAAR